MFWERDADRRTEVFLRDARGAGGSRIFVGAASVPKP
jgi:hypothetical protein